MMYYKIKNTTNKLNKRDVNFNKILTIGMVDKMKKSTIKIFPQQEIYLECETLPIDVQKYKMKKLILISEVSEREFVKLKKADTQKISPVKKQTNIETIEEEPEKEEEDPKENYKSTTTTTSTTTKKPKSTTRKSSSSKSSSTKYLKKEEDN